MSGVEFMGAVERLGLDLHPLDAARPGGEKVIRCMCGEQWVCGGCGGWNAGGGGGDDSEAREGRKQDLADTKV